MSASLNFARILSCFLLLTANILCPVHSAPLPGWAQAPVVQKQDKMTLKECILHAFAQSPEIAQQAEKTGIGQAQIDEAQSAWHPKIGLTGNAGPSRQYDSSGHLDNAVSYGITITQLVYDFGKTNNDIKLQTAARDSERFKLMATMTDVAEKTAATYMEVNRYQALIEAADQNIRSLEGVRKMAQLRADAGLNSSSDELQASTRIASIRSAREQYLAQRQSALAQLAVLTGVQPAALAPPPAELSSQPVELNHIDYEKIPAVLSAENLSQSASYGVEKTKSQYWPTVSIQGAKTRYETSDRSYWNDQLQLNVDAPLYQGEPYRRRSRRQRGKNALPRLRWIRRSSISCNGLLWPLPTGVAHAGESKPAMLNHKVHSNHGKFIRKNIN